MTTVFMPKIGDRVWFHEGDDCAVGETVVAVKQTTKGLLIHLGEYRLNKAGEALDLYSNGSHGVDKETFIEWGFKPKHLKKIWRKARDISEPCRCGDRYETELTRCTLLAEVVRLRKLVKSITGE